jgi:hypothetical protein
MMRHQRDGSATVDLMKRAMQTTTPDTVPAR